MFWAAGVAAAALGASLAPYRATERYTLGWGRPGDYVAPFQTFDYMAHRRKLDEADPYTFDYDEWSRVHRWLMVKDRVLDKELNMSTRLERRREAISVRRWTRIRWTLGVMFGAPLAIAGLALCWRVAVYLVVS